MYDPRILTYRKKNPVVVNPPVVKAKTSNPNYDPHDAAIKRTKYHARSRHWNSYTSWTPQEDKLINSFDGSDTELSEKIGRSIHSIQDRRYFLKGPKNN